MGLVAVSAGGYPHPATTSAHTGAGRMGGPHGVPVVEGGVVWPEFHTTLNASSSPIRQTDRVHRPRPTPVTDPRPDGGGPAAVAGLWSMPSNATRRSACSARRWWGRRGSCGAGRGRSRSITGNVTKSATPDRTILPGPPIRGARAPACWTPPVPGCDRPSSIRWRAAAGHRRGQGRRPTRRGRHRGRRTPGAACPLGAALGTLGTVARGPNPSLWEAISTAILRQSSGPRRPARPTAPGVPPTAPPSRPPAAGCPPRPIPRPSRRCRRTRSRTSAPRSTAPHSRQRRTPTSTMRTRAGSVSWGQKGPIGGRRVWRVAPESGLPSCVVDGSWKQNRSRGGRAPVLRKLCTRVSAQDGASGS